MVSTTYPSCSSTTSSAIQEIEDPQYKDHTINTNDGNFTTEVKSSTKDSTTPSTHSENTIIQEIEDPKHNNENTNTIDAY